MRFVVIASLRRGSIEPAEALNDQNQAMAFTSLDRDEGGVGEVVFWHDGEPYSGRSAAPGTKLPRVSSELRTQLRGAPVALDADWQERRRRLSS